jgi:hypothetical protein
VVDDVDPNWFSVATHQTAKVQFASAEEMNHDGIKGPP